MLQRPDAEGLKCLMFTIDTQLGGKSREPVICGKRGGREAVRNLTQTILECRFGHQMASKVHRRREPGSSEGESALLRGMLGRGILVQGTSMGTAEALGPGWIDVRLM